MGQSFSPEVGGRIARSLYGYLSVIRLYGVLVKNSAAIYAQAGYNALSVEQHLIYEHTTRNRLMSEALIGKILGDYIIQDILGRGGMAKVYRGYDANLQRYAAVKVIDSGLAMVDQAEYTERFRREARAIARLNHPNIVGVYQFGAYETTFYMAMAFVEGKDLRQILREHAERGRKMSMDEILNVVRGIGAALDYAHRQGVIHRDIKPSNIMINKESVPVLTDFGLVLSSSEGTLGETFGSAHYIAPEQAISSAKAVAQSDLYSLGICVYEMLVGKVPFDDPSAMIVALKHLNEIPPSPRDFVPDLPPALEHVISKILDKEPSRRYESGAAFADALAQAVRGGVALPVHVASPVPTAAPVLIKTETPPNRDWPSMDEEDEDTYEFASPGVAEVLKGGTASKPQTQPRQRRRVPLLLPLMSVLAIGVVAAIALLLGRDSQNGVTPFEMTTTAMLVLRNSTSGTQEATNGSESGGTESGVTTSPTFSVPPTITGAALIGGPTIISHRTSTAAISPTSATRVTGIAVAASPTRTRTPSASPSQTPTPNPTRTTRPSATASRTASVTASKSATRTATRTPSRTATPAPTTAIAAQTTRVVGATRTPPTLQTAGDVLLVYDGDQLNLINVSTRTLDITEMAFVQRGSTTREFEAVSWFVNGSAEYPPGALPPRWCFQIARDSFERPPATLKECQFRSSYVLRSQNRWFWIEQKGSATTFDVLLDNRKLATCQINAHRCTFKMP